MQNVWILDSGVGPQLTLHGGSLHALRENKGTISGTLGVNANALVNTRLAGMPMISHDEKESTERS